MVQWGCFCVLLLLLYLNSTIRASDSNLSVLLLLLNLNSTIRASDSKMVNFGTLPKMFQRWLRRRDNSNWREKWSVAPVLFGQNSCLPVIAKNILSDDRDTHFLGYIFGLLLFDHSRGGISIFRGGARRGAGTRRGANLVGRRSVGQQPTKKEIPSVGQQPTKKEVPQFSI